MSSLIKFFSLALAGYSTGKRKEYKRNFVYFPQENFVLKYKSHMKLFFNCKNLRFVNKVRAGCPKLGHTTPFRIKKEGGKVPISSSIKLISSLFLWSYFLPLLDILSTLASTIKYYGIYIQGSVP